MKSLILYRGWNLILSGLVEDPVGLDDPVSCRAIRWMITRAAIAMGVTK